jgi:hypothetical protein
MPYEQQVVIRDDNNVANVNSNGEQETRAATARPEERFYRATQVDKAYIADTQLLTGVDDDVSVLLENNTGSQIDVVWFNPFSDILTSWEAVLNPTDDLANSGTTRQIGGTYSSDSNVVFEYEVGTTLTPGTRLGIDILSRAQKEREYLYVPVAAGQTLGLDTNVQNLSGNSLQFALGYAKP